ncbi:poly-gamma-glutamate hydrolase family protein [Candidatus Poriferisodalis sp.]|uniref:poly-gamma-glutamate hydrolase family protein n=1 Tax=Candidatus Poriferisodalis sp. TaxID=3101277 RepID=UPI003D0E304D
MALHLADRTLLDAERPFAALLGRPGVSEVLQLRSKFGFMAFHGGWLEEITDDIAITAAERSGASVYACLQGPDDQWHLPSHCFDPADSAVLAAFLDHVDVVVAVHGFGSPRLLRAVLLGGRNRTLASHVAVHLIGRLPHYEILHRLDDIPRSLAGQHPCNPCNLPRDGGVQIELPPRIRGKSPMWTGFRGPGRVPHHEALIEGLAAAARAWSPTEGLAGDRREQVPEPSLAG